MSFGRPAAPTGAAKEAKTADELLRDFDAQLSTIEAEMVQLVALLPNKDGTAPLSVLKGVIAALKLQVKALFGGVPKDHPVIEATKRSQALAREITKVQASVAKLREQQEAVTRSIKMMAQLKLQQEQEAATAKAAKEAKKAAKAAPAA